jgi:amidase
MTVRPGPAWLERFEPPPGNGPTVAVKGAIDVAGVVTTAGSRSREDSGPAAADAPCVAAVRANGGRIVGITNLTELCWFADGINEHTGTPVNPIDPGRVPGGSSSGAAVVVALGEADVALGTDTGGSVRIPAAACGVAGLKTTRGRVSTDGVWPLSPGMDTVGPLARDVAGLVTGMRLLDAGFTPGQPPERPVVVRLRLGTDVRVDPSVDEGVDAALAQTGWTVREHDVEGWRDSIRAAARILDAEAGPAHRFLLDRPELLGDRARRAIEECQHEGPSQVRDARDTVARMGLQLAGLLSAVDAVALPTLLGPPPLLDETDELALTWATITVNALGWPAVSVPAWAPRGDGVVPPSVQLVCGPGGEERLLALAAQLPSQATTR